MTNFILYYTKMPILPTVCITGKLEYNCVVKYQRAEVTVVMPACQTPIKGKLKRKFRRSNTDYIPKKCFHSVCALKIYC